MSDKSKIAIFFAFIAMLMYQSFLIQRDDKLFKAYYHQKAQQEAQR